MRTIRSISLMLLVAASLPSGLLLAQTDQDEVLNFESYPNAPEVTLTVEKLVGVYVDFSFYGYLMNLLPGTKVRLLAYHPTQYYIQCAKPACKGWIDPTCVTPLKPEVIDNFKKQIEEDKAFEEAIRKKQILPRMSQRHVLKALGEPTQKNLRSDTSSSSETWAYLTTEKIYETVNTPVTARGSNGKFYTTIYAEKRLVGEQVTSSLVIEFKDGKVVALQQSKNNPASPKNKIPDQQWKPTQ